MVLDEYQLMEDSHYKNDAQHFHTIRAFQVCPELTTTIFITANTSSIQTQCKLRAISVGQGAAILPWTTVSELEKLRSSRPHVLHVRMNDLRLHLPSLPWCSIEENADGRVSRAWSTSEAYDVCSSMLVCAFLIRPAAPAWSIAGFASGFVDGNEGPYWRNPCAVSHRRKSRPQSQYSNIHYGLMQHCLSDITCVRSKCSKPLVEEASNSWTEYFSLWFELMLHSCEVDENSSQLGIYIDNSANWSKVYQLPT